MQVSERYGHLQKQEQRIASSLVQGLKMLSLPSQAMYDYLVELSMANPMLEIPEPPQAQRYENILGGDRQNYTSVERGKDPGYFSQLKAENAEGQDEEYDPYYSRGVAFEADALIGSLKLQLSLCKLEPAERAIGLDIIGELDGSGYFVGNLNTICLLYRQPLEVGQKVLSMIQGFQPRGIAAANVYEALCLQVDDSFPEHDLAKRIINENLRAICECSTEECAEKYGVSKECICRTFDYIRSLEPRPGNCDERPLQINYIVPDIIVKKVGDELQVLVSGEADNPLFINEYYLELLKQPKLNQDEKQYLRTSLNAACALIHSVDIRRQTLHRAALSLISMQGDFFRFGPQLLRPLTMQQLADEMGVNVSTVSRIVQDKYISTPWGMFPLKYFFVRALKNSDDGLVSTSEVKQRIEELIKSEDVYEPLTDDQICDTLNEEGYCLSRRTVSKYRQAAGIPGNVKRRHKRR